MIEYAADLLGVVSRCFTVYGYKALMTLFDMLGVFADCVGEVLDDPALTPLYMPHIMR